MVCGGVGLVQIDPWTGESSEFGTWLGYLSHFQTLLILIIFPVPPKQKGKMGSKRLPEIPCMVGVSYEEEGKLRRRGETEWYT